MNKKISLAFCLACLWLLCLFLTSSFSAFEQIPYAFKYNSVLDCITLISSAFITLMPIAIIILLIINQKKSIPKISTAILTIFSIPYIVTLIIEFIGLFDELPEFDAISAMTERVYNLIISLLTFALILSSARSIKAKRSSMLAATSNVLIIVATVFWGLLVLMSLSFSSTSKNVSFFSLLTNVVVGFSLCVLPKTIYDYENCRHVSKNELIIACIIAAVSILVICTMTNNAGGGSTGISSCSHQSCKENGPFYCMGKGDTCNNRTYCAYDLYCDECD